MKNFSDVLNGPDERHKVNHGTLRLNKKRKMCRASLTKNGLSDVFVKFHVASDKITCTPLQIDGKLL